MRAAVARLALCLAALAPCAVAAPRSPEAVWKAGIAEQNKDYAQISHAMLKIQAAAYLGEGQIAVLVGVKGQPGSWHWSQDLNAKGPLRVGYLRGQLHVAKDGKPVDPALIAKSMVIDKDIDVAGQPTQVGAGVPGWRIFIYNQQSPASKSFKSVSYYPYDAAFRVTARFVADARLPAHVFRTSRGTDKQFYHAGDAHLTLKGHAVTLPFYADSKDVTKITDISAFYTDELTGKGAYGAGRYVDATGFGKFPPKSVTIDFNYAYNPNCARSAHFTCPLAVDHIGIAMMAGERDPHAH